MATEITMPKLSDTMTDGSFIDWRKNVGDRIERGDVIAEVETDKAVMELEAFASGVLLKTMAKGGETVPVGTVLGLIGEPGELTAEAAPAPEAPVQAAPAAETPPAAVSGPGAAVVPPGRPAPVSHEPEEHEKASPLVRRLAREQGIDLTRIHGSGPEGRILQEDLQAATAQREEKSGSSLEPPPVSEVRAALAPSGQAPAATAPSTMRQAISATVSRSWQEIPHFNVTVEIAMEACREVIRELKGGEDAVGYNDLVLKACATALGPFPLLLSNPIGTSAGSDIHINFAVALPDGLLMPVIRNCQNLTPAGIAHETARLADKARNSRLASEELSGGRFSVSNLGMYAVDEFNALIMPGQVAILAVGAVAERAVVRNGQVIAAPTMRVTLSSDHRVVDGAYAAAFMAELRRILEQPLSMLIQHAAGISS